ncbi:MAG TPA: SGNH/GDSL hydrolase family protein [Anaerolineales bacterium]|nr:SGNH/GDSL hydrolase family protein [Anaerolineales bacterium]
MRPYFKPTKIFLLIVLAQIFTLAACNLPMGRGPTDALPATLDSPASEEPASPAAGSTAVIEIASEEPDLESTPTLQVVVPSSPVLLSEGPITLITLGDSLTEGAGDDERGIGYPGRLIEMLQAIRPGSTVFNFGISGWNSDYLINGGDGLPSQLEQGLAEARRAQAAGQPALALVWIGSNDLWYLYEYGPDPITAEAESFDLENYTSNLTHIITELQNAGAVVLIGLSDDQSLRPFLTNPPGEPVLPYTTADDLQRMSLQAQAYNEVIVALAAQFGAGVVDFYHTDIFTNPETVYEDGIHPNPHGYDLIAEIWLEAIRKILP